MKKTNGNDDNNHIDNNNSKERNLQAIFSCAAYGMCSIAMILGNKFVTTSVPAGERDNIPDVLVVCFQCFVAVVVLELAKFSRCVEAYPPLQWELVKAWLPINLMFIAMLYTSFMAYIYLSVPMILILKNLTNVITVTGDYFLFQEQITWFTIFSILVMTIGAVMAGVNDLQFSLQGYLWMVVNCVLTAAYTLYMRYASTQIQLPRLGMVFYNNILTVILLIPVCLLTGDILNFLHNRYVFNVRFIALNVVTGLFGVCLNFSSLWCVAKTSATTYAIVGTTSKVPVTILGFLIFFTPVTTNGLIFIAMGTIGGLLYAFSKLPSNATTSSNHNTIAYEAVAVEETEEDLEVDNFYEEQMEMVDRTSKQ